MKPDSAANKRWIVQCVLISFLFFSSASGFQQPQECEVSPTSLAGRNQFLSDTLSAGTFSVLTYNIAGLPQLICSAATKRAPSIAEIGRRINPFDIVHVQEDFNYNKYLYNSGNTHPFRTPTKGGVPFGDGLNTLSKYPILATQRIAWNHCTGADCLTPKGFTYSRLQISGSAFIDFYNVHANAYNHPAAAAARRENIKQLSSFIRHRSKGQPVIIMGDLNGHYSYFYDNVQHLLTENNLSDAWVELMHQKHMPRPKRQLPDPKILDISAQSESIDKILYRSSDQIELTPSAYNLRAQSFLDGFGNPLSDHHPVSLLFSWELKRCERQIQKTADFVSKRTW